MKNGLKVLLLKENRAPIITVQLWYRVGSRNECLGKTGISHLSEHMMFKGTAKYGPKFFSREVQRVGGSDNAFTGRDYTAYFETGPKDQLKRWLEMEADRMKGINVDEKNFELEKKVVIEERRLRTEDDPGNFMMEAATAATFEAHPYQWPVIGWLHDIESISLEDYQNYYHRYLSAQQLHPGGRGRHRAPGGLEGDRGRVRRFAGRARAPQGHRQGTPAIRRTPGGGAPGSAIPQYFAELPRPQLAGPGRLSPGAAQPHPFPRPQFPVV